MENTSKVLIFLGSPRKKGNTAILADHIAQGAESAGAQVESLYLNSMGLHPCQACDMCRMEGAEDCAVNDGMGPIYNKIRQADALVFATPVYWFTVSAQIKMLMDRFYAFGANQYKDLAGKKTAVAMAYGDEDVFISGGVNVLRTFQDAFRFVGSEFVGMVHACAGKAGEIMENKKVLEQAVELGKKLAG